MLIFLLWYSALVKNDSHWIKNQNRLFVQAGNPEKIRFSYAQIDLNCSGRPLIELFIIEDRGSHSRRPGYACPERVEATRRGGQSPPYNEAAIRF